MASIDAAQTLGPCYQNTVYLVTETGDFLVTESGDFLILESAAATLTTGPGILAAAQVLGSLTQIAELANFAPKYIPIGFGWVHTYSRKKRKKVKKQYKEAKKAPVVSPQEKAAALLVLQNYLNILNDAAPTVPTVGAMTLPQMQKALSTPQAEQQFKRELLKGLPPAILEHFEWDDDGEEEEIIQVLLHLL